MIKQVIEKIKRKNQPITEPKVLTLKDLHIGVPDGYSESQEAWFENVFYTGNSYYNKLIEDKNKYIITGKKGTGKTVLAKYYEGQQEKLGNPSCYMPVRKLISKCLLETGTFTHSDIEWNLIIEYILLVCLGEMLLEKKAVIIKRQLWKYFIKRKDFKYLKDVVVRRWPNTNFATKGYTLKAGRKAKRTDNYSGALKGGTTFDPFTVENTISEGYSSEIEKEDELTETIERNSYINQIESLKRVIESLTGNTLVNLIVDDIDEYDNHEEDRTNYIHFVASLIKVANRMNDETNKGNRKSVRIIIFLRSDIRDLLLDVDANINKAFLGKEIVLNWRKTTDSGVDISDLRRMLANKIRCSSSSLKSFSDRQILKRFLPERIMGNTFDAYIRNKTFGRPRDVIILLGLIQEKHGDATAFTEAFFKEIRFDFSKAMLGEVRNEMSTFYSLETIEECFSILREITTNSFSLADVQHIVDEGKHNLPADEVCKICYAHGLIGNCRNSFDGCGKLICTWVYDERSPIPILSIPFIIHPTLKSSISPYIPFQ